ncbi:matrix-remodeling-associated protein 5-like [Echeneis naucrates]|uniref:matrix-remodeling-associated protein 5-like n=1 Tax=Echeneis naucrates TaxID=173247 RepID=UPI001113D16C|nr:matrix-remodeling-associated protein 5-like [Echeneis naucrates]
MYQSVCIPAALLVLTLVVPGGQSCPRTCNCYQANEVHCTFRSLLTIPPGLPEHTRRINLGFNSISRIQESSLAGLKKVELLMLHSNAIHHLPDSLFKDMKSLQILKLSYNKLREIPSSVTFFGLTSLLRLYLDHNHLQHIHPRALLQLPSLRLLRLQGNRLHQLHPHTLCTLSLLNTYYFSTLRHLDLSNNSLTTLPKDILATAPLLETLVLQANPWSCDCRMSWFLSWSLAHPGLMKCPSGLQCPTCASPNSLQGQGLLDQTDLSCTSPVILYPERNMPLEAELSEIQPRETFREPLGSASVGLSDQQGNSVDLKCNVTHSDSQDITLVPDLSLSSASPIPLALSLSLECPVGRESYEKLWRILAYYSETAVRLEREIMLSKAPALAYRYRQTAETEGYYHTGVKASIKVRPQWLLQPAISIQLNREQSNADKVYLIYSTRVSAHPGSTSHPSSSSSASQPWVLISTSPSSKAMVAVSGNEVLLSCPLLSSGNPKVQWILPDGARLISPASSTDDMVQATASGLRLRKVQLSNAGLYYCVAQAGKDVDVLPMRLAVEESSLPPSGEDMGPPVTGIIRKAISLSCKASGSPEPHIGWVLPDGNIIRPGLTVSGGLTLQSNGSLSLLNPSQRDAGHYRCVAVNHYGSDSMSMQLELKPQHPPPIRTSFPRGPQSAAGRSTKIRAPLLGQMEEGSGDEEEEEERTIVGNRRRPGPQQSPLNRRYPIGKPRRRGPIREGPLRRRGPVTSSDPRRNRFENRHRVTTNKQRIDPEKWAHLLAKIRQKTAHTNNSQPITAGNPTAEPAGRSKDRDTARDGRVDDTERGEADGADVEAETEGSSVDDAVLQEEGLHPIHPVVSETHTKTEAEPENGSERLTETQTNTDSQTHLQTEDPDPQTETVTQKGPATSGPISGLNEIVPESAEGIGQEANQKPARARPQNPRQGPLPNVVPNSRPRRPWNSRRRIGQQRRIINMARVQPLIPSRPLPDPTKHRAQTTAPDSTTAKSNNVLVSTTMPLSTWLIRSDHLETAPNRAEQTPLSLGISDSESASPSVTSFTSLSPSHTKTHKGTMTHSAVFPDTALSDTVTPTPTHSNAVISQTSVLDTHTGTPTHGIQILTETYPALDTHVDGLPGKHSEEQERNLLDVPSETHSTAVSSTVSSEAAATMVTFTTTPSTTSHLTSAAGSTTKTSKNTLPTRTTAMETHPILDTTSTFIPTSSTTRSSTITVTSTTTTTTATPIATSTTPTTTITYTTTTAPTSSKIPFKAIPTTSKPFPATTTTTSTRTTTSARTSPTTTRASVIASISTPVTATTRITTTRRPLPRERSNIGTGDPRGRPVSGAPNQGRSPPQWKNPGANSIPDSHGSRVRWSPAPSLPAVPGADVLRSRPRIADPHIRIVSFPAGNTARLDCEAQGEPKPSITWTKVATGVVMSIHSKVQRFEVLPNGTLVIQNIQLQDRGTYICSAHSFLGRDRLLTTLEVWTRPPRMQIPSYRETTIHQGGELLLQCQADGVPNPLLSWVLPDRSALTSAASSSNRTFMDTNGTLHISVTLQTDRGVYRCVASNLAGAASASVRVHVSSLPPVIHQAKEEHLLLSSGRPVYAHCSARGAPAPTLRWRIPDGTLVRPSQFLHGNLFVLPNGTLHIRGVGPKDSGAYECTASNAVGADKRTVRVEIKGEAEGRISEGGTVTEEEKLSPPLHLDRPKTLPPPLGSSRSSSSYTHQTSDTNSLPKINKTVTSLPSHFTNTNKTKLSIPSLPSSVPTTNTKVLLGIVNNTKATSSPPSDKRKVSANLRPFPVSPFSKARIVSTSPSITAVHYGGILQLHCSVTGNPTPTIIWRTPMRKLVDMHFSFDRRLKVHPNGSLSVKGVTDKDAGDYLCIARNKVADDYRLLSVSVASKPAKIEPKQPLNQMVSFGKPLKVDCQASGMPDPAVHWSLPDGTMVNSVLQGEDRGGRARRLTVFDNGTLLVPAVGMGEEGEYTCYAENQGGQDTMKVKVKVMTSPPSFMDDRNYHIIKVRQGATAAIHCRATGEPAPTVTWFSPANRVIPRSSGSGHYSERVVVISNGILEVRQAQRFDTGNYTCRASNSAGGRSMVVGLEVEPPNHGMSGPVRGRGTISGPSRTRSGDNFNNAGVLQYGFNHAASSNNSSINGYNNNNSQSTENGASVEKVPATGNNEVVSATVSTSKDNGGISGVSRNVGISSSLSNSGTGRGHWFTHSGNAAVTSNNRRNGVSIAASDTAVKNSTTVVGVVTTVKQRALKGQTVLLPCPSQGSPPPRLSWLLPGNGVLPAPYYGSRLTVHRNGSLELRSLRESDAGTLVCVVRGERGEVRIQVTLEVSEAQHQARYPHRGAAVEKTVQKNAVLIETPQSGASTESFSSVLHEQQLHPRIPVAQKPLQKGLSLPVPPQPAGPPPHSSGPVREPAVSTRTASLVSIISGETLRLSCPAPQTPEYARGSLSWTVPSGKVLSRGESGDSGYVVQEDGTLTVQQASVFDRGTYTCRSTSQDSSAISVITVPVIVIAYPPRIMTGPSPVTYTRPGVAVQLPCQTTATPRATVTWETPDLMQLRVMGQARIYGNRYLSPQGSLVIQNPTSRDTGFYRCTAKNVIGVDTKATYLHVI